MADLDDIDDVSTIPDDARIANFSVGALSPLRQTLSWFASSAPVQWSVTNNGDDVLSLLLSGVDPDRRCRYLFQPFSASDHPINHTAVEVLPGETVKIFISVTPPPSQLAGFGKQTYHFTISAAPVDDQQLSRSVTGHLHRTPLLGSGALALVVLGTIALMFYLLYIIITPDSTVSHTPHIEFVAIDQPQEQNNSIAPDTIGPVKVLPNNKITYEEMFQEIARRYRLDWRLLARLAYYESRLDPYAVGIHDDLGLMQIIPSTWNEWAPKVGVTDPYDPYSNVLVGAAYLAFLRDYFTQQGYPDEFWMLVAYNWGPYNLDLFLADDGAWTQVPEISRYYALDILQSGPESAVPWPDVQTELATKTSTRP